MSQAVPTVANTGSFCNLAGWQGFFMPHFRSNCRGEIAIKAPVLNGFTHMLR